MCVGHFMFASLALQLYDTNIPNALIKPIRNGTIAENEYVSSNLDIAVTTFTSNPKNLLNDVGNQLQHLEVKFNFPYILDKALELKIDRPTGSLSQSNAFMPKDLSSVKNTNNALEGSWIVKRIQDYPRARAEDGG